MNYIRYKLTVENKEYKSEMYFSSRKDAIYIADACHSGTIMVVDLLAKYKASTFSNKVLYYKSH